MLEGTALRISKNDALILESPLLRAELGFSLLPLPRLRLNDLLLQSPTLHGLDALAGDDAASASTNAQRRQAWKDAKRRIRHLHSLVAFRRFHIEDGRISIPREEDALQGRWDVNVLYKHGRLDGRIRAELPEATHNGHIALSITGQPYASSAIIKGVVSDLSSRWLHGVPLPAWLTGADYPINLSVDGEWKRDAIARMDITAQAGPGTFTWPDMFSEPMDVRSISAKAHIGPGAHAITLHDIVLELPETTIRSEIDIKEDAVGYGLTIQSQFPSLPTDRLSAYWPLKLAPITRIWAVGNIRHGMIHDANLRMQLRPEDLDAPSLPKAALRAAMRIEGVEVQYLPNHPPAHNVAGMVTFSGQDMRLELTGADYLTATHFDAGSVAIPSFDAPETALDAEFSLRTSAQDVATLFATKEIDLAEKLHLTKAASGTATGEVGIHAIIFSSKPDPTPEYYADQFKYRVKTKLLGVSQPKFLGDTDIADAKMELSADNHVLAASGTLQLNGVPAKLDLSADFVTDKTVTKVAMDLPANKLPAFGYPIQQGVGGSIGVNATMTGGKHANATDAALDLTATTLDLPVAGLHKPAGEKASLRMSTQRTPGGGTLLDPLTYQGKGASLTGSVMLDAKSSVQSANIGSLRFGRQNASIRYQAGPDGVPDLYVRGASLDLVALRADRAKHDAHKPGNPLDFGPLRADVELGSLWLVEGLPIEQFHAQVRCSKALCESADIRGNIGADKEEGGAASPFALRILQENGARRLRLNTDNGGRLLAALDVSAHVSGGKLKVEGTYDDDKPTHPLIGKARMEEFYVRQAPLLTKILSLTSPTGIVNALMGKGIGFDGLSTAFTFEGGTLHIKDARASGSALGLTAEEGSVQLGSGQVQLKGTVIPAYMLNSVIGKIPVVGDLLMGGKGQGLIATRFSLSGNAEDPSVSVNPLSILTPGFLRGVFDVFDKKEAEPAATAEPKAEKTPEPGK